MSPYHRITDSCMARFHELKVRLLYREAWNTQVAHNLEYPLIVSLTSYLPRFKKLDLTVKCLLNQKVRPDKIILWIADQEIERLPDEVTSLTSHLFEIRPTKDIGPFKKIIPSLKAYPGAFIATCDDDTYYNPDWLLDLISCWDGSFLNTACHRAREVGLDKQGRLLPYNKWQLIGNNTNTIRGKASVRTFPTGVGGVLYPPGSLPSETLDETKFLKFCPTADDVWLFWMNRVNGGNSKTCPIEHRFYEWRGCCDYSLYAENVEKGKNDVQLSKMQDAIPLSYL